MLTLGRIRAAFERFALGLGRQVVPGRAWSCCLDRLEEAMHWGTVAMMGTNPPLGRPLTPRTGTPPPNVADRPHVPQDADRPGANPSTSFVLLFATC